MHFEVHRLHNEANSFMKSNSYIFQKNFIKGETISKASNNLLNSPKTWTKLTILSKEEAQDSEFRSYFVFGFLGKLRTP